MDRYEVLVTVGSGLATAPVAMAPGLLSALGLATGQRHGLRFGQRRVQACFQAESGLEPAMVILPDGLAKTLGLSAPLATTMYRLGEQAIAMGPLIGLMVSRSRLAMFLDGRRIALAQRYARYAREVGATLFFFRVDDLNPAEGIVLGHQLDGGDGQRWLRRRFPVPRVIYDRCLGKQAGAQSRRLRRLARDLRVTVLNRPIRIAKLQAFRVLEDFPELAPHLPFTVPLTRQSLAAALAAYTDLYLKPNALSQGRGVIRLTRQPDGWLLRTRQAWGTRERFLSGPQPVRAALGHGTHRRRPYLIQEGLPLVTYLGNRFDFRYLVQKDGRGEWLLTGSVARIAATGSPITSPRSGGQVASVERVLRHAFPDRWPQVLRETERVALELARHIDHRLGPCAELGLDLGVVQDGTVKLIEINGKPLKVSLERLHDPLAAECMYRYPIHYAAHRDLLEVDSPCSG